jgi:hypothetical protein
MKQYMRCVHALKFNGKSHHLPYKLSYGDMTPESRLGKEVPAEMNMHATTVRTRF